MPEVAPVELFRFATVRAATKADVVPKEGGSDTTHVYHGLNARFLKARPDNPYIMKWVAQNSAQKRREIADEFVAQSAQYVLAEPSLKISLALERAYAWLLQRSEAAEMEAGKFLLSAFGGGPVVVSHVPLDPVPEFLDRAWASVYAVVLSSFPDVAAVDRLVSIIRTLHILPELGSEEAARSSALSDLLEAKLLITPDVLRDLILRPVSGGIVVTHPSQRPNAERRTKLAEAFDYLVRHRARVAEANRRNTYAVAVDGDHPIAASDPYVMSSRGQPILDNEDIFRLLAEEGIPVDGRTLVNILEEITARIAALNVAISPGSEGPDDGGNLPQELPDFRSAVKPFGVTDLRLVRQTLVRYQPGEIAHVENIMAKETRNRVHRWLRRVEASETEESEKTVERTTDLQSTERYEVQTEISSAIKEDERIKAGVTVTADFGNVKVAANAEYARSNAREESSRTSTNYAKEVVSKALDRVIERVRTERTRKVTEENEETNSHAFSNEGEEHVVGIYRWIEKVYSNQVVNYGKRLMFQISIPEPAYFLRQIVEQRSQMSLTLKPPEDISGISPASINENSYLEIARRFKLGGVEVPPAPVVILSKSLKENANLTADDPHGPLPTDSAGTSSLVAYGTDQLAVPSGYRAEAATLSVSVITTGDPGHQPLLVGSVGGQPLISRVTAENLVNRAEAYISTFAVPLAGETNAVSVALAMRDYPSFSATLTVYCWRTPELYQAWQLAFYEQLVARHRELSAVFQDEVISIRSRQERSFAGKNPVFNRQVERNEIKKLCIMMLSSQAFESFGAVKQIVSASREDLDIEATMREAPIIRFFEDAFDWGNMTYTFAPYYWANKRKWHQLLLSEDQDDLFTQFLQAGYARVILPVTPELEQAVLFYADTGKLIPSSEMLVIEETDAISTVDELAERYDPTPGEDGEPWNVVVPTSVIMLQPRELGLDTIKSVEG